MKGSLLLPYGPCEVELLDEPNYTRQSGDNLRSYDCEYFFLANVDNAYSRHGVILREGERTRASCVLFGGGGPTTIHNNSAVIVGDELYVAVGDTICCLSLPSLGLNWFQEVDMASCFGVYYLPVERSLISHGECEIVRLSLSGDLVWKSIGRDIFTNGFRVFPEYIQAVDFYGAVYNFSISNGTSQVME